jgi:hypothetical protein
MAPSGAVQVLLLWVGVLGCMWFPNNRTYVALALVIPPLIGTVLLLKLSLDAGWGMIASSWLVSSPYLSIVVSYVSHVPTGFLYNSCLVYPAVPHSVQCQG